MSAPISRSGVTPSIQLGSDPTTHAADAKAAPPEKQGPADARALPAPKATAIGSRSSTFERLRLGSIHAKGAQTYTELRIGRAEQRLKLWRKELEQKGDGAGSLIDMPVLRLSNLGLTTADLDEFIRRNADAVQRVNILYLNRNDMDSLPQALCRLNSLAFLNLDDNKMFELPPGIGDMAGLTHLHLSGNLLVDLPDKLGDLANLTELYLYENALTGLPDTIGKLSRLEVLDVSRNALTALPDSICQLPKLKTLLASQNDIAELPAGWNRFKEQTGLDADFADQSEGIIDPPLPHPGANPRTT